ncbi:methyltransferase [Streptomyces violaceusniger]|uniref:methyltransferase n=1 Tax=Streptomyces violaceusniger TaxID=68280 RepID=UPI0026BDBA4E
MRHEISPEPILQVGLGFMASKALLTAVELDLFSQLAEGPRTGGDLAEELGLHPRGAVDFLDALVALGFLERSGGAYRNSPSADAFLDRKKATYVGGILEMANVRLYPFWGSLTEALRTGEPQNEHKHGGDVFDAIYRDQEGLEGFLHGMTGLSMGKALVMAERFPWAEYRTVLDVGGAVGCLPVAVAQRHSHMSGGVFELPRVRPVFEKYVASFGLEDRLTFHGGDFFTDDLPGADVIVLGQILHGWGLEEKRLLLEEGVRRAAGRGSGPRLRRHHRRRPRGEHLRSAGEPEHAHRDPVRLRVHGRRRPRLDDGGGIPQQPDRTADGRLLHAGGNQIAVAHPPGPVPEAPGAGTTRRRANAPSPRAARTCPADHVTASCLNR